MKKKTKVLVLDGGSRQILPILKGLHELGCIITTLNSSKLDNGYTSRYANKKIIVSRDEYYEVYNVVLREVKNQHYDIVIPVTDNSMNIMTLHKEEIEKYAILPIPNRKVFISAYNKQLTMETCMDIGVPCPITKREAESVESFIKKVGFPIVAKPRMACGSMGLKIVKNKEQLDSLIKEKEIVIDEYVLQEFIPQTGKQYNIHLFRDKNDELSVSVVTEKTRWYPVDGGASCLCRTINDSFIKEQCEKLLKQIHWRSYCEIEMIVDPRDKIAKVMEINGRASASIKIMDLAGVNVAKMMLDLAYCKNIEKITNIKQDVRLRRISTDFLWFVQSRDRFTRKPSWFSMKRTHEAVFSLSDPMPFFATGFKLLISVNQYRKEMKKRKRA